MKYLTTIIFAFWAFSAPPSNGGTAITGHTATSSQGGVTGTGAASAASNSVTPINQSNVDLQISLLTTNPVLPATLGVGATLTVNGTLKNFGTAAMTQPYAYVNYYLSTNTTLETNNDILIGFRLVNGALAAGATSAASTSVTLPPTLAPGTYYILAVADAENHQLELPAANENNNVAATAAITVDYGVNLRITSVTAPVLPLTVARGANLTVTDTMLNVGTTAMTVSNSYIIYYISADNVFNAADTPIGYRQVVGALGPGATSTGTTTFAIPSDAPTGAFFLFAVADGMSEQNETDESVADNAKIVHATNKLTIN